MTKFCWPGSAHRDSGRWPEPDAGAGAEFGPELAACSSYPSVAELTGGTARLAHSGQGRKKRSGRQCRDLSTASEAPLLASVAHHSNEADRLGPVSAATRSSVLDGGS